MSEEVCLAEERAVCELGAFLLIVHYGRGQDVSLSCPGQWVEGQEAVLNCSVQISQWRNPPCNIVYSTTLTFKRIPNGQSALQACSVTNVNTTNCVGTKNAQGCGCTTNSTHYNFFYQVAARSVLHENNAWECQPGCVASPTSLSVYKTTECYTTHVIDACDGNPCHPGNCTVVNNKRSCSCVGTYYAGDTCKNDLCADWGPSCQIMRKTGAIPEAVVAFGYKSFLATCTVVTHEDNCKQLGAGILIGIGAAVIVAFCLIVRLCVRCIYTDMTKTFHGKTPEPPTVKQRQQIKDAIVDYFSNINGQATRYILYVFDKPADGLHPTEVTFVCKNTKDCKDVEVQIQDIINKYNPGAYPMDYCCCAGFWCRFLVYICCAFWCCCCFRYCWLRVNRKDGNKGNKNCPQNNDNRVNSKAGEGHVVLELEDRNKNNSIPLVPGNADGGNSSANANSDKSTNKKENEGQHKGTDGAPKSGRQH